MTTTRCPTSSSSAPTRPARPGCTRRCCTTPRSTSARRRTSTSSTATTTAGSTGTPASSAKAGPQHTVIGEVSPGLPGLPGGAGADRDLPRSAELMATLRDPAARAFSSYLYMRKHGLGEPTFAATHEDLPRLLEHGRYGTQLRRYLRVLPPRVDPRRAVRRPARPTRRPTSTASPTSSGWPASCCPRRPGGPAAGQQGALHAAGHGGAQGGPRWCGRPTVPGWSAWSSARRSCTSCSTSRSATRRRS